MYQLNNRVTVDENICNGKPTIRGMRITVQTVLEFLLAGDSPVEILAHYPMLEAEDIDACKQFAIDIMNRTYSIKEVA
jgi:uncharacterized protein (DUF433 family)